MKKQTEHTLLWVGGGIAALFAFYELTKPATTPAPGTSLATGTGSDPSHAPVSTYAQAVAENPNVLNSNYVMTDAEAQTLLNNYLDLRQGLVTGGWNKNILQAARDWWKLYGVAEKRVFVPLVVPSNAPYVPKSGGSSSGSSWVGSALTIATTLIGFLGVNDMPYNPYEEEVLFMGGAIAKDILPMYRNNPLAVQAMERLNTLMIEAA